MSHFIDDDEGIDRVKILNPDTFEVDPANILITAGVGGGKTLAEEQYAHFFYRNGYTIISLSDVKDSLEQAYTMFEPTALYHLNKLNKFGCPKQAIPTKIYHPFTFDIPTNQKLPPINFYTLNIKSLTRTDLTFLAESLENKRSIQILLETLNKLKNTEGLHHLIFYAEEQTENQANLQTNTLKLRSDNPDDFFTRTKIGNERTSGEMNAYFKPFIENYTLTPTNTPTNLNIKQIMNDQKNYHIFTTKWIKDRRLKSFYILHLLQELINNSDHAQHPICIIIEEIRFLTPHKDDGFTGFLADEIKNTMTRMRNMGKGYAIISTTQVYKDVHPSVIDSFNEHVFGRIKSLKEIDMITKTLKLEKNEVNLLKSLEVGEFLIQTKEKDTDEPTFQKIHYFLPPHAHKEQKTNFFDTYAKKYPDQLRTTNQITNQIQTIKQNIIEQVMILKDKENQNKKAIMIQEKQEKAKQKTDKIKIELNKAQRQNQQAETIKDNIKQLIYQEYTNSTGKDKSLRTIAKKFNILLADGTPNPMAIKRIIQQMTLKEQAQNETNN